MLKRVGLSLLLTLVAAAVPGCSSTSSGADQRSAESTGEWNAHKQERSLDIWRRHLSNQP